MILGIILEATDRRALFLEVTETRKVPTKNSRECITFWVMFQTIADFWGPIIEVIMGLERFCAVIYPGIFYKLFSESSIRSTAVSTMLALICILIPVGISIISPTPNVRYSCGRKAAFSVQFGTIDYCTNVFGYLAALFFNLIATIKASFLRQSQKHMQKLKCYTGISLLSTILISIPNLLSIINANFSKLPDWVMTPAILMACVNCGLNFFVYLFFNSEFRRRFFLIFTCGKFRSPKVSAPIIISKLHEIPSPKRIVPEMTKIVSRSL
uniref:G-protein coupled receptors family 1 profile domain-containing protein n=1 Tax=Panagrolaimus sp. PS1159 TaxID=55785 RepID=A0AC35EU04_9BILA